MRNMAAAVLLALMVTSDRLAFAQQLPEGITAEQLEHMSKAEISKFPAIPTMTMMMATGSVKSGIENAVVMMIEDSLYTLRFYLHKPTGAISSELTDAIKAFQRQSGYKATGTLVMEEYDRLSLEVAQYKISQVQVVPLAGDTATKGPRVTRQGSFIHAEGTWVSSDMDLAFPINSSQIDCAKDEGICRESIAELVLTPMIQAAIRSTCRQTRSNIES
jgi:peptidoglycan hydrolase-like protein with peptidoglycan-binding domain